MKIMHAARIHLRPGDVMYTYRLEITADPITIMMPDVYMISYIIIVLS